MPDFAGFLEGNVSYISERKRAKDGVQLYYSTSKFEGVAEIGSFHFFVVNEVLDGAGPDHLAFEDQIAAVDDGEDFTGVVVGY